MPGERHGSTPDRSAAASLVEATQEDVEEAMQAVDREDEILVGS